MSAVPGVPRLPCPPWIGAAPGVPGVPHPTGFHVCCAWRQLGRPAVSTPPDVSTGWGCSGHVSEGCRCRARRCR